MLTISDLKKSDITKKNKKDSFSKKLKLGSFFLLIKPTKNIYTNTLVREKLYEQIEKLIKLGFINIEVSWSDNKNWLDYVFNLKLKFPKLNLGTASVVNKQSIDESIKVGTHYSMMQGWDRDLLNYSNSKNHLLIPGVKNLNDLKEAININCKIIKIYPVKDKTESINISQYKNINFIAAGGLSISDIPLYKSLGYKSIVIGDKGFKNNDIDPKIYKWLKEKSNGKNNFI